MVVFTLEQWGLNSSTEPEFRKLVTIYHGGAVSLKRLGTLSMVRYDSSLRITSDFLEFQLVTSEVFSERAI